MHCFCYSLSFFFFFSQESFTTSIGNSIHSISMNIFLCEYYYYCCCCCLYCCLYEYIHKCCQSTRTYVFTYVWYSYYRVLLFCSHLNTTMLQQHHYHQQAGSLHILSHVNETLTVYCVCLLVYQNIHTTSYNIGDSILC